MEHANHRENRIRRAPYFKVQVWNARAYAWQDQQYAHATLASAEERRATVRGRTRIMRIDPLNKTRTPEAEAMIPTLHQLFAHDCSGCGEGNLYYDRPDAMACDHCGEWCEATALGEPFSDPALDEPC